MSETDVEIAGSATPLGLRHEMWRRGDLSYKLDELQLKIKATNAGKSESLVLSSRQIGKSFEELIYALEFLIKNPYKIARFATDTYDHIAEIVEDNMIPICWDAPPGFVRPLRAKGRWQVHLSSLRLGALERQYVDGNRGGNASLIILEEGGFVKSADYKYALTSVFGPQLLRSMGELRHITTVSEDADHYIHTEILPKCELLGAVSRYTVYDSPSISELQIEAAIKLCGGKDTPAFRREYLAIIERNLETVIIPKFDKNRHVVADWVRPSHINWVMAWDFGGTRDLDAAVFLAYDYPRAKIRVPVSMWWPRNTNTNVIVADLKAMEEKLGICDWGSDRITPTIKQPILRYGDGPPKLLNDVSVDEKYHIIMPSKTNQPAAVNALDIACQNDEIELDPVGCPHLITTLSNGKFNKTRTDFERTDALGHFDSGMAFVYAYRHIDTKNPFPQAPVNRDLQVRVKPQESTNEAEQLSKLFDKTRPRIRFQRK